jgi:hypothetical protein
MPNNKSQTREPTYHYTAEDHAEINPIDDWDWEICDLERGRLGPTERIEDISTGF